MFGQRGAALSGRLFAIARRVSAIRSPPILVEVKHLRVQNVWRVHPPMTTEDNARLAGTAASTMGDFTFHGQCGEPVCESIDGGCLQN
jgi:hypothetical protein